LGARTAQANSIGSALAGKDAPGFPREDTVPFIRVPNRVLIPKDAELEKFATSQSQEALHAFADFLHREADKIIGVAVSGAAKAAGDVTWIAKALHSIGKIAMSAARMLNKVLEMSRAARAKRTEDAFARLVQANVIPENGR
jgi:hypothetical protein